MKPTMIRISILMCFFATSTVLNAQTQKGELQKGKSITTEIEPGALHRYQVRLVKDQFAFFKLMQQGVDMKITTYDSKGEKLEDFDSPNGKNGPELFSISSNNKGTYIVEVSPFDEDEPSGNYNIVLSSVNPKAVLPNDQVDELFTPWNNIDTPGASVAIVKDGAIIYKKGYGMANLEYDIPIDPSTIFHIASVSKQFTVFSILLLEKEGKLSLDDDIRKHIPEVPDFGHTITLRHLASHTSGLRDQWNLLSMAGWRMDDVITKEHVLKLVSKQKDLNFIPGDEMVYCNTGFTLLAEVVARVSGQSFAEFTKTNIFDPLKMTNTLFYDDHEKIVKNRAYSYYSSSEGYKKSVLNYANVGATSLFTTVEDLSLWSLNFTNPKIGNADIINTMNTQTVLNDGKKIGGALGQFVGKYKGLNEIQHGGADAGYRSYLSRFVDQNFAVSVFSNSAEFNSGRMAHKIVDIYLKDEITVEPKKEKIKEEKSTEDISVDQNTLKSFVGEYELQEGFIISITEDGGQLLAKATGQATVALTPITTTEFQVAGVEAKIEFIPNGDNNVNSLKLHQGGQIMDAPRLKAFDKSAVDLSEFSGNYYSEELSTTYNFAIEDGKLIAKHSRLENFDLDPMKEDVFTGDAWFFRQIEFIRDDNKLITGCKVTAGRVRNLYFKKMSSDK